MKCFNSFTLHILAMILMLADHLWATLFPYLDFLTCIGRIAFPIFAFMIVEGYFHTSNINKYIKRMFIFALISEIPFDLLYASTPFYPFHQNVLWTFLISLLLIRLLENIRIYKGLLQYVAASVLVIILGYAIGTITMVDYYGAGILLVLMFYFLRGKNLFTRALQALSMYFIFVKGIGGYYYSIFLFGKEYEFFREGFALLSLIPIWLYNGQQGYHAKWFKWFCYGFYPGHLLLLYIIWQLVI